MKTTPGQVDTEQREPEWSRTGRAAAYTAGSALLAGTVLFLLDASGLLGSGPAYRQTAAGPLADQAPFFAAYFAHHHRIVWDIIARDTILPIAYLALIAVALAVQNRTGPRHPAGQFLVASFIVGGTLSILADVTFLAASPEGTPAHGHHRQ